MKLKLGKLTIEVTISWRKKKMSEEEILLRDKPYMSRVIQSIREGRKLEAVKIYKDETESGLKESVDYINSIWETYYRRPENFVDQLAKFQAEQLNK